MRFAAVAKIVPYQCRLVSCADALIEEAQRLSNQTQKQNHQHHHHPHRHHYRKSLSQIDEAHNNRSACVLSNHSNEGEQPKETASATAAFLATVVASRRLLATCPLPPMLALNYNLQSLLCRPIDFHSR
jgi:hypothetical protein